MIDVLRVFDEMDRALAARGFVREDEHYAPDAFGHRTRTYRRHAREALALVWEARDYWMILQGGIPWRDLAVFKAGRESAMTSEAIVATLLGEVSRLPDFDPAL